MLPNRKLCNEKCKLSEYLSVSTHLLLALGEKKEFAVLSWLILVSIELLKAEVLFKHLLVCGVKLLLYL